MARQVKIQDRDRGLKKLMRFFKRTPSEVRVGVLGKKADTSYSDGTKTITVAIAHEFGVPGRIPQRSFLRATAAAAEKRIEKNLATAALRTVQGSPERQELARFGVWFEGVVKKRIASGIGPPLAASTVARKGSSKPLIDTGQLRKSITSEVVK